jgi:hypothetical protein
VIAERSNPTGFDDRWFRLLELPAGSMRSALGALSSQGEPRKPAWVPVWKFASDQEMREAERALDAIMAPSRKTELVVLTRDMIHFEGVWGLAHDAGDPIDRLSRLGISGLVASPLSSESS